MVKRRRNIRRTISLRSSKNCDSLNESSGTMNPFLSTVFVALAFTVATVTGDNKILLRDLRALTLRKGRVTQGRRAAPVPQLRCVGGSAGRDEDYWPSVVQCENKGYDGYDYQWECKADMSQDVQFGELSVSCEGYDYPEDPYVLRGSCGLEYHLEFTKDGLDNRRRTGGGGDGSWSRSNQGGSWFFGQDSSTKSRSKAEGESSFTSIVVFVVAGLVVYGLYTAFVAPSSEDRRQPGAPPPYEEHQRHSRHPPSGDAPPPYPHGPRVYPDLSGQNSGTSSTPPPAGWNFGDAGTRHRGSNIHGFSSSTASSENSGSRTYTTTEERQQQQQQQQQEQQQGFSWGTLFAGGLLGYLFGSSGRNGGYYGGNNGWGGGYGNGGWGNGGWGQQRPRYGGSWFGGNSGWGSGGGGFGGGSFGGGGFGGGGGRSSPPSGSRTASGFGGTTRR